MIAGILIANKLIAPALLSAKSAIRIIAILEKIIPEATGVRNIGVIALLNAKRLILIIAIIDRITRPIMGAKNIGAIALLNVRQVKPARLRIVQITP